MAATTLHTVPYNPLNPEMLRSQEDLRLIIILQVSLLPPCGLRCWHEFSRPIIE